MAANLTGIKFGRLIAMHRVENTEQNRAQWLCRCDCGSEKVAQAAYLNKGTTRSCGCLGIEQRKKAAQTQVTPYSRSTMGRERKSWEAMLSRCYNPDNISFNSYGERGITVCDRWRNSFKVFVDDMGRRPTDTTLERIDNNANYEPENCKWATRQEQANNRRTNRSITINGQTLTVAQWARKLGISCFVIHTRLYNGLSEHDAVMSPVKNR